MVERLEVHLGETLGNTELPDLKPAHRSDGNNHHYAAEADIASSGFMHKYTVFERPRIYTTPDTKSY